MGKWSLDFAIGKWSLDFAIGKWSLAFAIALVVVYVLVRNATGKDGPVFFIVSGLLAAVGITAGIIHGRRQSKERQQRTRSL